MTRAILLAALLCSSAAYSLHLPSSAPPADPDSPARITSKAVWNPSPSALANIREVCSAGDPAQNEACFVDSMRSAGASPEAAQFVKDFAGHGLAYIRAFRDKYVDKAPEFVP